MATVIDQHKIDNTQVRSGPYPRSLAWWRGFVPNWAMACAGDGDTIIVEPVPRDPPLGRAAARRQAAALDLWIRRIPLLGPAVISEEIR